MPKWTTLCITPTDLIGWMCVLDFEVKLLCITPIDSVLGDGCDACQCERFCVLLRCNLIMEVNQIYVEVDDSMYYSDGFDRSDVCIIFRSKASMYYSDVIWSWRWIWYLLKWTTLCITPTDLIGGMYVLYFEVKLLCITPM